MNERKKFLAEKRNKPVGYTYLIFILVSLTVSSANPFGPIPSNFVVHANVAAKGSAVFKSSKQRPS